MSGCVADATTRSEEHRHVNARSVVAGLAILALVLPSVSAVHGSDAHHVGCGDGVEASPVDQAEVTVEPGDECGATYDSSDQDVTVTATLGKVVVDNPAYPTTLSDSLPNDAGVDDGIEHPLRSFLSNLDAALDNVSKETPAGENPEVWADAAGVHVAAKGEQADVAWPHDPLTGRKLIDHEHVYVPTRYQASSDDVVAFLDRTCREILDDATCPAIFGEQGPVTPPSVIVGLGLGEAGTDGTPNFVAWRVATEGAPELRAGGTAPSAPFDLDAAPAGRVGDDEVAYGSGRAASEPSPVPSEALPVATVATAAIVALGAFAGYRRLKDGEILEHSLRHRIYDYILENPGATVQEISDALGVDYSTADHHASVLHDFDLIHRREQGRVSYYFENHGTFDAFEKEAIPLLRNGTSSRIARIVRDNPKITPSSVARKLDVDPSTVKWHVDKLRSADLLDTEPLDGRSIGLEVPQPARDVVDRWV